jgi:2-polyprenyl-3-methyl-5-hydroxy-6-metoxy-1,4-benzoquinol methylase
VCVCVLIFLQVLEVGAGNSHLSEEMYRDGITNITCTDLSPVAVKRMHTRFQEFPGMVAAEANMLNLPFDDQSFDVVIEKGAMVGNSTSLLQSL